MIDVRTYGAVADATTNCTSAINAAILVDDIIIKNGTYQVESEIIIPSNRTIYIKNAKIILKSNCHTNLFRNQNFQDGVGNENIKIIGQGNAIISGNSAGHNDGYVTWGRVEETTYKYYLGLMIDVRGFEIRGINFVDNAHWGVLFQGCTGYAGGAKSIIDNCNVNMYNVVENQDAFDFGWGTHDIDISNITCVINDDPWAIFACNKSGCWVRTANTPPLLRGVGDVYNLTFTNIIIKYSQYHPFVVLTGDGNKIHDITFNNMKVYKCGYLCYFGLAGYYDVAPTKDDTYNFTLNDVTVIEQTDTQGVIKALESCKNITFTNFVNSTGKTTFYKTPGKTTENFLINGVAQ